MDIYKSPHFTYMCKYVSTIAMLYQALIRNAFLTTTLKGKVERLVIKNYCTLFFMTSYNIWSKPTSNFEVV